VWTGTSPRSRNRSSRWRSAGGVGARLRCKSQEAWIATQRMEGGIPFQGIPPSLSEAPREAVLQQFDGRVVLPEQRQCGSPRVGESVWFSRLATGRICKRFTEVRAEGTIRGLVRGR
jgi:hypothetical protein